MTSTENKSIDPILDDIIKRIPPIENQAQYDTNTQLQYLIKFANKTKLYDAADIIQKLL